MTSKRYLLPRRRSWINYDWRTCTKSVTSLLFLRNNYEKLSKLVGLWGTDQIPLQLQLQEINQQVELRARFVAKGCSQHVNDPVVDCYAATPSTTSLKTLLLLGILQGHQTTCLDNSTAFINTPLPETEEIYVQPPQEWYYNSPTTLWRLKKAMYGLHTSPKLWQLHLGRVYYNNKDYDNARLTDRLYTTTGLGALVYVDDLLLVGETTKIEGFITTLKATFTLKHVDTLSRTTDVRFLGKGLQLHEDNSISISLEPSYYENMLCPHHLDGKNVKTITTTRLEQQPLEDREKLDPQQHRVFRTTVGQLIWASLDRPDLMCATKLHSSRLQGPTERDLRSLKHTIFWDGRGTTSTTTDRRTAKLVWVLQRSATPTTTKDVLGSTQTAIQLLA